MKIALRIIGAVLILFGILWFLQGIGVLPGSMMSGQLQWAINGGIAAVVGAVLIVVAGRIGQTKK